MYTYMYILAARQAGCEARRLQGSPPSLSPPPFPLLSLSLKYNTYFDSCVLVYKVHTLAEVYIVQLCYYMCPRTTYYLCILILLDMCPHLLLNMCTDTSATGRDYWGCLYGHSWSAA